MDPLPELSRRFWRRQRAQMWLQAITLLLLVGAVAASIVAGVVAWKGPQVLGSALAEVFSGLQQQQSSMIESCSFAVPAAASAWLVVGDAFLANLSWPVPPAARLVESIDDAVSLAVLLDRAASQVQDLTAAGQPLVLLLSYGYARLLSRQEGVDGLYQEAVAALGSHPELLASPDTLVLLFRRPLPPTRFVPSDRQVCLPVFNAPSSVEQSMVLAEGASRLSIEALQYALLAYPPGVQVIGPSWLVADRDCVMLSPEQSALLDAYLAPCLSGGGADG